MTKLLEKAFEAARVLPPEKQDEFAAVLLELMGGDDGEVYRLSPEEEAAIERSMAAAARGEFASEEDIRALVEKYRL